MFQKFCNDIIAKKEQNLYQKTYFKWKFIAFLL